MSAFSVFRASFDGALRPNQRRRARFAASTAIAVTVAVLAGGFLTILHLNANQLADMANSGPASDVRVAGADTAPNGSCEGQAWPFIEGRCLIDTNAVRKTERVMPRLGLAKQGTARPGLVSHDGALASRKKRARAKSPDVSTSVAARARGADIASSTTGAAPRSEATNGIQPAKPSEAATPKPIVAAPAATPSPQKTASSAVARRAQEQKRREARRQERLTREQREARAESRARREDERSSRRWNDYGNSSPYDGGWQNRGMQRETLQGGFFPMIR